MQDNYISHYIIKPDGTILNKKTNRPLRHYILANGYHQIMLYDFKGSHKKYLVHRLVAMAHIPNPYNLPQVNHKDMDKDNNSVDNLEWCSALDNIHHARANGRDIYTPERNAKISHAKKGVSRPESVRKKISETLLSKHSTGFWAGKHLSKEHILKRTHSRYHKDRIDPDCPYCL